MPSLYLFDIFREDGRNGPTPRITFSIHDVEVLNRLQTVFFNGQGSQEIHKISPYETIADLFSLACRAPELNSLFHFLLTSDAIRLEAAKDYSVRGGKAEYGDLFREAASRGDNLIGFVSESGEVVLSPSRRQGREISHQCKLILIRSAQ